MKTKRGFTVLEVVLALAIMVPAVFAIIGINFYIVRATESSRLITTALADANTVIERIRNTSSQGLSQVVATYPNNQAVAGVASLPAQNSEQITVAYQNVNADPLAITVTASWTDRGRNMSRALATQVTQR